MLPPLDEGIQRILRPMARRVFDEIYLKENVMFKKGEKKEMPASMMKDKKKEMPKTKKPMPMHKGKKKGM